MQDDQTIRKRIEKRIDNFFVSSHGAIPSNPKTWATVLQTSIARKEIESGEISDALLSDALLYAVKKSIQSGAMSKNTNIIEVDESEAIDMDRSLLRRAICFAKKYVHERKERRTFPKTPVKWLNVLRSEIHPHFPFAFPEYALGPVANKVCRWYLNDSPLSEADKNKSKFPIAGETLPSDAFEQNDTSNALNLEDDNFIDGRTRQNSLKLENTQFVRDVLGEESQKVEVQKQKKMPLLHEIEENDMEKLHLIRKSAIHCLFCGANLTLVKNLIFVKGHRLKQKVKDRLGVMVHYVAKTITGDWYSQKPEKSTKARCFSCSKVIGWPYLFGDKQIYILKNKNILFKMGNQSLILTVADLKKQNSKYVTEAFWRFLKSKVSPSIKQTWNCINCTSENIERKQTKCDICNYNRISKDEWACLFCTFFNEKTAQNCEICNSPREKADKIRIEKIKIVQKSVNLLSKNSESVEKMTEKENISENKNEMKVEKFKKAEISRKSVDEEIKNEESLDSIFNFFSFDKKDKIHPEKEDKKWREQIKIGTQLDFRTSPQSLGKGNWVPGIVVQIREEPRGLSLEIIYEGYPRSFEWVPIVSARISPHKSKLNEYQIPETLPPKFYKYTSYSDIDFKNDSSNNNALKSNSNNDLSEKLIKDGKTDEKIKLFDNEKSFDNKLILGKKSDKENFIENLQCKKDSVEKPENKNRGNNDISKFFGNKSEIENNKMEKNREISENKEEKEMDIKDRSETEIENFAKKFINSHGGASFIFNQSKGTKAEFDINLGEIYNFKEYQGDSRYVETQILNNLPKMNRTKDAVPDEFKGTCSWGYMSDRAKRQQISKKAVENPKDHIEYSKSVFVGEEQMQLFCYNIVFEPKTEKQIETMDSFAILLQQKIEEPEIAFDVYLNTKEVDIPNTNNDAVAKFVPRGAQIFNFKQIERIKTAHCFLNDLLSHARIHPEMLMDSDAPMFLVVPLDERKSVDWSCIDRINETVKNGKTNFVDYLKPSNSENRIPFDQLVLTTIYNTQEQHLYTFTKFQQNLSAFSKCDNENAKVGASWNSFFKSEFGITLKHPELELFTSRQIHPRAHSVLIPPSVAKSHVPPTLNLVQELCEVHPVPLNLVTEMPDVVSTIWGLQNSLSVQRFLRKLPVPVSLSLLEEAMTFSVANNFRNYELLEFLGDSVLKYLATDYLFCKFKNTEFFREGNLTEKRKDLISNTSLLEYGKKHQIYNYSIISQFQRKDYIPPCFVKNINKKFKVENPIVTKKQIADLVEAVLGATFLSSNNEKSRFEAVTEVLKWFGSEIELPSIDDGFCLLSQVPKKDRENVEMAKKIQSLEEKLNYCFRHKQYAMEAIYQGERLSSSKNHELLEFLGDSVLDFLCTRKLFYVLPNTSPEDLTEARIELVCNDSLAETFESFRMEKFVYKMFLMSNQKNF
ncbi:hypothetical protein MHBO_000103 [Bonamia ostreae]|uniref:Uncharacterized protein n=1 Tax=Bonamia ostreae TaxID=126728 RepID=A0ABV2AED2_9EUKA